MYSKENTQGRVETFDNKCAISQMAKYNNYQNADGIVSHPTSKKQNCQEEHQIKECSNECIHSKHKKGFGGILDNISLDDILLIFLIILFLTDNNQNNDFVVPVILFVLLLN